MPQAPTAALEARLARIRRDLAELELDALVVTAVPNILYLTNFSGSSAIAIVTADRVQFLTDARYVTAMQDLRGRSFECPGLELIEVQGSYDAALAERMRASTAARVGFEAAHLTVSRFSWLERRLDAAIALVPTEGVVERARVVKDAYEVMVFRAAGRLLSSVAAEVLASIRSGRSEREVALDIDWKLRRAGFERPAFDTIVASGPNAALPHARPTERKLREGDLVVLDFGGVYDSYCVDLTRTVSIGPPDRRAREVHAAVLDAHDHAIAAVRAGASRFAVDAAARDVLAAAGFGAAFSHGTGHGLGIDIHEDPRITRRRPDVDDRHEALLPGMVFTIEPGATFRAGAASALKTTCW
jgi:Xaa-Pro aminopeptidase